MLKFVKVLISKLYFKDSKTKSRFEINTLKFIKKTLKIYLLKILNFNLNFLGQTNFGLPNYIFSLKLANNLLLEKSSNCNRSLSY